MSCCQLLRVGFPAILVFVEMREIHSCSQLPFEGVEIVLAMSEVDIDQLLCFFACATTLVFLMDFHLGVEVLTVGVDFVEYHSSLVQVRQYKYPLGPCSLRLIVLDCVHHSLEVWVVDRVIEANTFIFTQGEYLFKVIKCLVFLDVRCKLCVLQKVVTNLEARVTEVDVAVQEHVVLILQHFVDHFVLQLACVEGEVVGDVEESDGLVFVFLLAVVLFDEQDHVLLEIKCIGQDHLSLLRNFKQNSL